MKYIWLSLLILAVATSTAFAEEAAMDTQTETTQNVISNQVTNTISEEEAAAAEKLQTQETKRNKWDFSDRTKKKETTKKAKKDPYEGSKYDRGSYTKPRNEWVSEKDTSNHTKNKYKQP